MLALVSPGTLPIGVEDEFRRIRSRGTAAKMHLALAGPLELAGGDRPEAISIGGGHVDELERAFDAVKYGRFSARHKLGELVLDRLATCAPTVRERLVAMELLTPADLATELAVSGGQLHHGEHAFDQLFVMRPAPSATRYATPLPGLYLGGSGSHPGGGVRPTAGLLAAEALLAAG